MPRRGKVPKRDVLPDPLYGSKVVTKLINQIMLDGEKSVAQGIVYDAFKIMSEKLNMDAMEIRHAVSAARTIRFPSKSDPSAVRRLRSAGSSSTRESAASAR